MLEKGTSVIRGQLIKNAQSPAKKNLPKAPAPPAAKKVAAPKKTGAAAPSKKRKADDEPAKPVRPR
jgi:hypothetical protein